MKNYNIKKKKNPHHTPFARVMRLVISNIFSKEKKPHIINKLIFGYITQKKDKILSKLMTIKKEMKKRKKKISCQLDHCFFPEDNLSIQSETVNFSYVNNLRNLEHLHQWFHAIQIVSRVLIGPPRQGHV